MSSTSTTEPELPSATQMRAREDETTRTILDRAARRARRVSTECQRLTGERPPAAGPTEWIDPLRVAQLVRPRPPVVQRPLRLSEPAPRDSGASPQEGLVTPRHERAR